MLVVAPPLLSGCFGRQHHVRLRRVEEDKTAAIIARNGENGVVTVS
jgi:hypothetical protein